MYGSGLRTLSVPRLQEFEALEAQRLLVPKQIKETVTQFVSLDKTASEKFISYCQGVLGNSCKRVALLYGSFVEKDGEIGVQVDAVYEPAQDCTPTEIVVTEPESEVAKVDEVAGRLGLVRVGWIFFRPVRFQSLGFPSCVPSTGNQSCRNRRFPSLFWALIVGVSKN